MKTITTNRTSDHHNDLVFILFGSLSNFILVLSSRLPELRLNGLNSRLLEERILFENLKFLTTRF